MKYNRQLLILDLDETLIHSAYVDLKINQDPIKYKYFYIYERPYLKEFLNAVSDHFDLAIWSASKSEYVKTIIRKTVLKNYNFQFVFTRSKCQSIYSKVGTIRYLKKIELIIDFDVYNKIIVLDDYPEMILPIENCLKVKEFRGSESDDELMKLIQQLILTV
jgi:TFIIF-interacting CTD phosphatase-like protein